jgi:hypothetical protein
MDDPRERHSAVPYGEVIPERAVAELWPFDSVLSVRTRSIEIAAMLKSP